jgi:hypothetical protein
MPTLSFHAPATIGRKIRAAARRRKVPVSRFLRDAAESAATLDTPSGLGRELERLAIDGLALASLERVRNRSATAGLARLTPAQIQAEIRAGRRARR